MNQSLTKILSLRYQLRTWQYQLLYQITKGPKGIIYTLHRVDNFEPQNLFVNETMKVSPTFLEDLILKKKKQGVQFVSLDDIYNHIIGVKPISKPFVAFTLDDGYLDNYEKAYPIFLKHQIPFTIYVTTNFPDHKAILWWYLVEDLIIQNDSLKLGDGRVLRCKTPLEKERAFKQVRAQIVSFSPNTFEHQITQLLNHYPVDLFQKVKALSMSWEQIVDLSKDPLCTIGGHSINHFASNRMSEEDLLAEVKQSLVLLEDRIHKKVEHYAYPFGSPNEVGSREFELMKKTSLKTAVVSYGGCISPIHSPSHLMALPRTMLIESRI